MNGQLYGGQLLVWTVSRLVPSYTLARTLRLVRGEAPGGDSPQTDQGDETEGMEREGLERKGVKRLFIVKA
jgi:hypothetical protein